MSARTTMALALGASLCFVALSCAPSQPAYTPEQAKECAEIEARWVETVVAACYGQHELKDCPAVLDADKVRFDEQTKVGCR